MRVQDIWVLRSAIPFFCKVHLAGNGKRHIIALHCTPGLFSDYAQHADTSVRYELFNFKSVSSFMYMNVKYDLMFISEYLCVCTCARQSDVKEEGKRVWYHSC